jgi:hypothetical protein
MQTATGGRKAVSRRNEDFQGPFLAVLDNLVRPRRRLKTLSARAAGPGIRLSSVKIASLFRAPLWCGVFGCSDENLGTLWTRTAFYRHRFRVGIRRSPSRPTVPARRQNRCAQDVRRPPWIR